MNDKQIKSRLAYLRKQIVDEWISTSEIAELQNLAEYIDKGDTLLLQWAGVPEFDELSPCPNCEAEHPAKDVDYHGDQKYSCPSCK